MKTEKLFGQRIACYDNGGKTIDRYTVAYMDQPERAHNTFACVAMNHEPFHPQGFGQHSAAMPGKHLGNRIPFAILPDDCRKLVEQDLRPEAGATEQVHPAGAPGATFTPGPWDADKWAPGYTVSARDAHYSVCHLADCNNEEANAHLIAAAPDMFAALEILISLRDHPLSAATLETAYTNARAALAKARGK